MPRTQAGFWMPACCTKSADASTSATAPVTGGRNMPSRTGQHTGVEASICAAVATGAAASG